MDVGTGGWPPRLDLEVSKGGVRAGCRSGLARSRKTGLPNLNWFFGTGAGAPAKSLSSSRWDRLTTPLCDGVGRGASWQHRGRAPFVVPGCPLRAEKPRKVTGRTSQPRDLHTDRRGATKTMSRMTCQGCGTGRAKGLRGNRCHGAASQHLAHALKLAQLDNPSLSRRPRRGGGGGEVGPGGGGGGRRGGGGGGGGAGAGCLGFGFEPLTLKGSTAWHARLCAHLAKAFSSHSFTWAARGGVVCGPVAT